MAPTKRGGASATAKRKPKNALKPIKEDGKPTLKGKEEDPPTKKIRRSARNAASNDEPNVDAQLSVDNNGAHTHTLSSSNTNTNTNTKNVIIEHCKQCQCFKVRAQKVEKEVKGVIPDVEVIINPEKPRRGCFEIRDGEGNIFLSLQNMPRPFTKLKQWDLDSTIADIIEKIK